jgi:hypothetical protein
MNICGPAGTFENVKFPLPSAVPANVLPTLTFAPGTGEPSLNRTQCTVTEP